MAEIFSLVMASEREEALGKEMENVSHVTVQRTNSHLLNLVRKDGHFFRGIKLPCKPLFVLKDMGILRNYKKVLNVERA
jgi:hypothetical protein